MKRLIAFTLVCVLLSLSVSVNATSDLKTMTSIFTDSANLNAKEWMSNEEYRALLTCCLALDYLLSADENNKFDIDVLSNASYAGRNGFIVSSMYLSSDNREVLVIMYHTLTKEASYMTMNVLSRNQAETAFKAACNDGLYKNDVTDVYSVYQQLMETFGA